MPLYGHLAHALIWSTCPYIGWGGKEVEEGLGGGGTGWRRTYRRDLALDVVEQLLLSSAEEGMLELGVLLLWLQQPAMLHVHHLPEPV